MAIEGSMNSRKSGETSWDGDEDASTSELAVYVSMIRNVVFFPRDAAFNMIDRDMNRTVGFNDLQGAYREARILQSGGSFDMVSEAYISSILRRRSISGDGELSLEAFTHAIGNFSTMRHVMGTGVMLMALGALLRIELAPHAVEVTF